MLCVLAAGTVITNMQLCCFCDYRRYRLNLASALSHLAAYGSNFGQPTHV